MENIFDSHAHYDAEQFAGELPALLPRIRSAGVTHILTLGDSIASSRRARDIAREYDYVWYGAGVHPENAGELPENWLEQIAALAAEPRCRAIGEIGLDYYWPDPPREVQPPVFTAQLELAKDMALPVSIHDRDAHGDMFDILRKYRPKGVLHRFSGSAELAEEAVKLGLYLGYGGSVTYKGGRKLKQALEATPLERILLETDCPYLAPEPWRGQRCDSGMLVSVCEAAAAIKGISAQELADISCENAQTLFGV